MKGMAALFVVLTIVLAPITSFAGTKQIRIESIPSGAKVTIDGREVGITPLVTPLDGRYWYELNGDKRHFIRAELPGYVPFGEKLNPTQMNMGSVIAGMCCLFPFLWAYELPDTYVINLIPEGSSAR